MRINIAKLEKAGYEVIQRDGEINIYTERGHDLFPSIRDVVEANSDLSTIMVETLVSDLVQNIVNQQILELCK